MEPKEFYNVVVKDACVQADDWVDLSAESSMLGKESQGGDEGLGFVYVIMHALNNISVCKLQINDIWAHDEPGSLVNSEMEQGIGEGFLLEVVVEKLANRVINEVLSEMVAKLTSRDKEVDAKFAVLEGIE